MALLHILSWNLLGGTIWNWHFCRSQKTECQQLHVIQFNSTALKQRNLDIYQQSWGNRDYYLHGHLPSNNLYLYKVWYFIKTLVYVLWNFVTLISRLQMKKKGSDVQSLKCPKVMEQGIKLGPFNSWSLLQTTFLKKDNQSHLSTSPYTPQGLLVDKFHKYLCDKCLD